MFYFCVCVLIYVILADIISDSVIFTKIIWPLVKGIGMINESMFNYKTFIANFFKRLILKTIKANIDWPKLKDSLGNFFVVFEIGFQMYPKLAWNFPCSPGWPRIYNNSASASWMLGLQACGTKCLPGLLLFVIVFTFYCFHNNMEYFNNFGSI